MSVEYRGDVEWKQSAPTAWNIGGWGTDQASVLYRGSRLTREDFQNRLAKWSKMPGFPFMFLEDWSEGPGSVSFPAFELHYIGFRTGSVPPPKPVDTVSLQTAQGSGIDKGKRVTGSFVYKASRTTWTWFETVRPAKVPRYTEVRDAQNPFNNIESYSIEYEDDGKKNNGIPYSAFVAVFNSLAAEKVISDYTREPIIPNTLWACRAEADWKLA